jgi:predicted phosphodiesterase
MNKGLIGLLADSHSNNSLLEKAIEKLRSIGAVDIIHLGDICDSLNPSALDKAVQILKDNNVKAVLGNNDYIVIADSLTEGLKEETVDYLKGLPYTIKSGGITFTHSSPFEWPAATRRPISDFIHSLHPEKQRLIFRGHSHTPSIVEVIEGVPHKIKFPSSGIVALDRDKRYIITVGAVEKNSIATFDPNNLEVRFLSIQSISKTDLKC